MTPALRFDAAKLDDDLAELGVDLLLATSRHNVGYLLGGYRFFFFDVETALGLSVYTPVLGYPRGKPDGAFYIGSLVEDHQQHFEPIWVDDVEFPGFPGGDLTGPCARRITALGLDRGTIGIEPPFLPTELYLELRRQLPDAEFVNAAPALEELRRVKKPWEIELIRTASDLIVESMVATFERSHAGMTTLEIERIMREEEAHRGLVFDYCLTTTGPDFNRAPSDRVWEQGASLNLDSGGRFKGYVGDLSRNGVAGTPTQVQIEILEEVDAVQQAARSVIRAGALGREVDEAGRRRLQESSHRDAGAFLVHGVGLIGHEAPRLVTGGPVPYAGIHAHRPLEPNMVLSVETSISHPAAGYVKLEDTVIVTPDGSKGVGDDARGWTSV